MSRENGEERGQQPEKGRRRFLKYALVAILAGGGGAWYTSQSQPSPDRDPISTPTTDQEENGSDVTEGVPAIVNQYAPDLYFGSLEKWYPTDPRPYIVEKGDGPVVDGFTAVEEYASSFNELGDPPAPTVFYHVVEATDGVDAIQYWLYSVFDQFTVNFHWHDWELLQVFVDRETDSPLLLSASAHSRACPNNEFLNPDLSADRRPGILSEVGSHSSANDVNDVIQSFERIPSDQWDSDITNDLLDITKNVVAPFAYGLPRDEGSRQPFVMPELDGVPLHQHPDLAVDREDFIDERVTVGSWGGLPQPPKDLPLREPGHLLAHPDSPSAADITYELKPIGPLQDEIEDFVGPQLSFEFAIPGFLEDKLSEHISTVGVPWAQDRFANPLSDVTDPVHRQRISGNTPSGLLNRVVGKVQYLGSGSEGTLGGVTEDATEALSSIASVSLFDLPVEVAVRLASSDPVATTTRNGIFGLLHVDPGEHLLVVNGPGFAPTAERFNYEGGLFHAGAAGELTLVAKENVGWIRGNGRETNGIDHVRVIEEYAGVVYDGQPVESDRFAVPVHRHGRYTVEIIDTDGRPGAFRIDPVSFGDNQEVIRKNVETGKASLAVALRDKLEDLLDVSRTLAEREEIGRELVDLLSRGWEEADVAAQLAQRGEGRRANEELSNVVSTLETALELLASQQREYSDAAVAALEPRIQGGIERAKVAIETELA